MMALPALKQLQNAGDFSEQAMAGISGLSEQAAAFGGEGGLSDLGAANPLSSNLLEINPFMLVLSIIVVYVMYMTDHWSYWIKIILGLLMVWATFYFTFPFTPSNLPYYVLFIYAFMDYMELNKKKKRKKKKKKSGGGDEASGTSEEPAGDDTQAKPASESTSTTSSLWTMWWFT